MWEPMPDIKICKSELFSILSILLEVCMSVSNLWRLLSGCNNFGDALKKKLEVTMHGVYRTTSMWIKLTEKHHLQKGNSVHIRTVIALLTLNKMRNTSKGHKTPHKSFPTHSTLVAHSVLIHMILQTNKYVTFYSAFFNIQNMRNKTWFQSDTC